MRTDQVGASTAAEACFEARGLGTSYPPSRILATLVAGTRWKLINMRKSAIFGLAGSVPATEALPVALASHLVFADQTPRAVEARVAAWGAEGVVLVLDRHLELRAAAGIATIVTRLCDTHADAYRDRKPDRLCRRPGELVCVSEHRAYAIAPNEGAPSRTRTNWPWRASARAAVSPPSPPPMMRMGFFNAKSSSCFCFPHYLPLRRLPRVVFHSCAHPAQR